MEAAILLRIHACSHPALDAAFWVSDQLGFAFCAALVVMAAVWHLRRGERGWALLWIALGLGAYVLQEGLKALVQRPRPELWPPLVSVTGFSFPSGHAVAAATFYPLLARDVAQHRPELRRLAYGLAAGLAFFVGFGRLYLGVHWPSDVVAGWALGVAQMALGVQLLERRPH